VLYAYSPNGTVNAYLSTGSNFNGGVYSFTPWCTNATINVGDVNGDGKSDLLCKDSAGTISVALSTGTSFTGCGSWLSGWCASGAFRTGDFNGDGKQDLYCANSGQIQIARSGAGVIPPDLLASVSNGLGGTSTIAYMPSTQYTNTQLPFPIQTVSSITTN